MMKKLSFSPSKHGFHFGNTFVNDCGIFTTYGLCGGMSLAVFNYYRHGIPIPTHKSGDFNTTEGVPPPGSQLRQYIFTLQVGSYTLSPFGWPAPWDFQSLLRDFNLVRAAVDGGRFLLLGLRMAAGEEGIGHQVLAYGYDEGPPHKCIFIYDSNYPDKEILLGLDEAGQRFLHEDSDFQVADDRFSSYFIQTELDPHAIDIWTESSRPTYMDVAMHEGSSVNKPLAADGLQGPGELLEIQANVRNFGHYTAHFDSLVLWVKDPQGNDRQDLGVTLNIKTLSPGVSRHISHRWPQFGDQVGSYTLGLAYGSEQGHLIQLPAPLGNTQNPLIVNVVDRSVSRQRWYRVTDKLSPAAAPAVGVDQNKQLELFARKSDGSMLFLRQRARNDSKDWKLGRLPGDPPMISGSPSVVPSKSGRLEVFARGRDGQLWHCWQNCVNAPEASDWSSWVARGGNLLSDPAASRNEDGRLEVFAVFKNGMMHKLYQDFVDVWSIMGFVAMPGPMLFAGNPSAHRDKKGRLVVAVRGKDNGLWLCQQQAPNGPYYPWATLGGSLTSDPVLACDQDGRLEVFALGADNRMRHCWQKVDLGWTTNWRALDDHLPADQHQTAMAGVRCAASLNRDDGCLVVAVTVAGGRVKTIAQATPNGGWGSWRDHGGPVEGTVALGINPNGVLELFARDPLNQLQHTWFPV